MIGQNNLLKLSNITVINKNKQFFKIELETDAIIKSLATLTIYNWQSINVIDNFVFPTASHM